MNVSNSYFCDEHFTSSFSKITGEGEFNRQIGLLHKTGINASSGIYCRFSL